MRVGESWLQFESEFSSSKMNQKGCSFSFLIITVCLFSKAFVYGDLTKPVDLTWTFENNTIYWTGVRPFSFTQMLGFITKDNYWVALNEFCAGEHGGTHIDAPYHFDKNGIKVGQLPIEKLIVPGAVVDISNDVDLHGPSTTLQVQHLVDWEEIHGPFEPNTLLLINFGYSKYYPNKEAFLGPNHENGTLSFPGISPEAAQWIVNSGKFVGVGVDTASADPGHSTTSLAHRTILGKGLYIIETVKILEPLPARDFMLLALPMNIAEGTGAPVRLVAVPHGLI